MKKQITPITPSEILDNLEDIIPSFVFEAVNAILKEKFRGTSVTIKQNEIITKVCQIKHGLKREDFFEKKWLDIEKVYEKEFKVIPNTENKYECNKEGIIRNINTNKEISQSLSTKGY